MAKKSLSRSKGKRRVSSVSSSNPMSINGTLAPKRGRTPKPTEKSTMVDVQSTSDLRRVAIDRVGVKDVKFPIRLKVPGFSCWRDDGKDCLQNTVATINMYVSLPHYQKGTHMSRFLEVLNSFHPSGASGAGNGGEGTGGGITPMDIPKITEAIRERLDAEEAHFEAMFTYFVRKPAPITKTPGLMDYRVKFECTASRSGKTDDLQLSVAAPATSLCPCSKEISDYGAHNQRCEIEARVRTKGLMWIEELVSIIENAASCPVFAVLKRPDEKWVTERAYDNPKFVEDIIRDLALGLENEPRILSYAISSENFESIHSHNAYAQISRDKRRARG